MTGLARAMWHRLEAINAVTYFSPECVAGPSDLGLKGFWMGYFASRAAPMGPVPAAVVQATFFNFHPERVRRAIPEAWERATPTQVLDARAKAAASALRRLLSDQGAEQLAAEVLGDLGVAIEHASPSGRPLFAANAELPVGGDPVAALWQAATTLREHRGDNHAALLTAGGLDGCEVHVLFAAAEGTAPELYQQSRGWSPDDWGAAVERLTARRLLAADRTLSPTGHTLRDDIERRTDELSVVPYLALSEERIDRLLSHVGPAAATIGAAGEIRFPNPMGLPAPAHERKVGAESDQP